jgi:hypothetical protein
MSEAAPRADERKARGQSGGEVAAGENGPPARAASKDRRPDCPFGALRHYLDQRPSIPASHFLRP